MKRRVGLIILIILLVAGGAIYMMNQNVQNEKIEKVVVSWGGGFGTKVNTQTIEAEITENTIILRTELYGSDGGYERLSKEIPITTEVSQTFFHIVEENQKEIKKHKDKSEDIFDAPVVYVQINDERYGGYASNITNQAINTVVKEAMLLIGDEPLAEFREEIASWYVNH